jgi:hypothetical protein
MPLDPEIAFANRAATARIRELAARSTDEQLATRVGEHWTVGVVFAHLSFWDRRVVDVLDRVGDGTTDVDVPTVDVVANDLALPGWLALAPRAAAGLAITAAEELDRRLEAAPDAALARVGSANDRWVRRHLHRNEHLDEAEAALRR